MIFSLRIEWKATANDLSSYSRLQDTRSKLLEGFREQFSNIFSFLSLNLCKKMTEVTRFPSISVEEARQKGYDCGFYGPNVNNNHFSLFSNYENIAAFEEGRQKGLIDKSKIPTMNNKKLPMVESVKRG